MPTAATGAPRALKIGAPSPHTPTRHSSRFSPQPRAAVRRSSSCSASKSTMLFGVCASSRPKSARSAATSSPAAASSALPEATQQAGARPPTRE